MATIFPSSTPAGYGNVHLTASPPQFATMTCAYPLKLISPSPYCFVDAEGINKTIHTLFVLSYGGGLVAGDKIDLHIRLDPQTRLILLTQGSTKIFCTPDASKITLQHTTIDVGEGAALCYIPDPVQPFADSAFGQRQTYRLRAANASLCVCDWVCCGRAARGERWSFWRYGSRNEVYDVRQTSQPRLLLRDHIKLDNGPDQSLTVVAKVEDSGVFGTLFMYGPEFQSVGAFFLEEFAALPRIGEKDWGDGVSLQAEAAHVVRRKRRQLKCERDGVIWTAAHVRGFVMVKFAARDVEGARSWLRDMLVEEGSLRARFGERALLCLK